MKIECIPVQSITTRKLIDIDVLAISKSLKVFLLSTILSYSAVAQDLIDVVVEFDRVSSWQQSLAASRGQGKLIFVDVYTDWCAPCKIMDRDVFTNDKLSEILNTKFIALKVNADKVESDFASSQGINSYPTLLFLSPTGEEIYRQEGAISKYALIEKSQEVLHYWENKAVLDNVDYYNAGSYSLAEIGNILDVAEGFPFTNKVAFAERYLSETSPITDLTLELTMDQLSAFSDDTYKLIAPMVGQFLPSIVMNDRIGRKKIKWRNEMKSLMDQRLQKSINEGNFLLFEHTVQIHMALGDVYDRDLDRYYKQYFRRNDLDRYAEHAIDFVAKHITANSPEKIHHLDEERFKEFEELRTKYDSELEEDIQSRTPNIDSLERIYNISQSIANQLMEISSDFYAFYEDPALIAQAEQWAEQAYDYYPIDVKYYENHIAILETLGDEKKIKSVEKKMRKAPFYQEMLIIKEQRRSDLSDSFFKF
jgi:thiol-disulfide isomerase/thioredoxin